jgi:hypothetical protein
LPGVARDDGDAEHVRNRRLDQGKDRLRVGAARPCAVLIDDDFAFFLGGQAGRKKRYCRCKEQGGAENLAETNVGIFHAEKNIKVR